MGQNREGDNMRKLADRHRDKVIDLLNERLVFERSGVKLYDKILSEMKQANDPLLHRMHPEMKKHRDQEKEHEEWLEDQIRNLGGDAHAQTEHSKLIVAESSGIEGVVLRGEGNGNALPHLFHALLTAELVDNAGWELLLELADRADDDDARRELRKRLHEEEDHLYLIRRTVSKYARKEVLGEGAVTPVSP
jgi:bacterioferritin (cytochrome b1)